MPAVDGSLKTVALGQQGAVLRRKLCQKRGKTRPKGGRVKLRMRGQDFVFNQAVEMFVDLQAGGRDVLVRHRGFSKFVFLMCRLQAVTTLSFV